MASLDVEQTPGPEGAPREDRPRATGPTLRQVAGVSSHSGTEQFQRATPQVLERRLGTKGKDKTAEDCTLEEMVGQGAEESGRRPDQRSLTSVGESWSMAALACSSATRPTQWSQHFDVNMAAALGGQVQDSRWPAREYGERPIQWGSEEPLRRWWAMLSELHRLDRMATELAGRSQGDWQVAWTLTGVLDRRPPHGSIQETSAAAAESQPLWERASGEQKGEQKGAGGKGSQASQ